MQHAETVLIVVTTIMESLWSLEFTYIAGIESNFFPVYPVRSWKNESEDSHCSLSLKGIEARLWVDTGQCRHCMHCMPPLTPRRPPPSRYSRWAVTHHIVTFSPPHADGACQECDGNYDLPSFCSNCSPWHCEVERWPALLSGSCMNNNQVNPFNPKCSC